VEGIAAALGRVRPTRPLDFGLDALARDLGAAYARAVATRPAITAAEVAA
jgi:hypothetical protein